MLLRGNPDPAPLPQLSPILFYLKQQLQAIEGGAARIIVAHGARFAGVLLCISEQGFGETQIFLCLQLKFLFKPPLISGSAKPLRLL